MYVNTVRKFQKNPKPKKVVVVKPLTKAQQERIDLQNTIRRFKDTVEEEIRTRESRWGANFTFIDWEIDEDFLDVQDKYYNWRATFKPDTYMIRFLQWLQKEGFKIGQLSRRDALDKEPGEFNVIYSIRIYW